MGDHNSILSQGNRYFDNGDMTNALALYNQVLALHPNSAEALTNKATIFLETQNYKDALITAKMALNICKQLAADDSENASLCGVPHYICGQAYFKLKQYEASEASCIAALEAAGKAGFPQALCCKSMAALRQTEPHRKVLGKVHAKLEQTIVPCSDSSHTEKLKQIVCDCDKVIRITGTQYIQALLCRAVARVLLGEVASAKSDFRSAKLHLENKQGNSLEYNTQTEQLDELQFWERILQCMEVSLERKAEQCASSLLNNLHSNTQKQQSASKSKKKRNRKRQAVVTKCIETDPQHEKHQQNNVMTNKENPQHRNHPNSFTQPNMVQSSLRCSTKNEDSDTSQRNQPETHINISALVPRNQNSLEPNSFATLLAQSCQDYPNTRTKFAISPGYIRRSTMKVKQSLCSDLLKIEVAAVVDAAIAIGTASVIGSGHNVHPTQVVAMARQLQKQAKLGMVQELKRRYLDDILSSWYANTMIQEAAKQVVNEVFNHIGCPK